MESQYQDQRINDILSLNVRPIIETQITSFVDHQPFNAATRISISRFNLHRSSFPYQYLQDASKYLFQCLDSRAIPLNFPSLLLSLALHLVSKDGKRYFLCQYWPQGSTNPFDYSSILPSSQASLTEIRLGHRSDTISGLLELSDASDDEDEQIEDDHGDVFPVFKAAFLAAYLLKMLTKTSINVFLGLKLMRARFTGFYPGSIMPRFSSTKATFEKIRLLLSQSSLVKVSWVETIANFESAVDPLSDHAGMVRYLANMPFSYTGMHAYPLLLELKRHTKREYRWILHELYIPDHENALLQLIEILNEYERCVEFPFRPTHFKYARLYSPSFFLSLHSKKCSSLIYVLAQVVGRFMKKDEYGGLNSIMAISTIGGPHKLYLDAFARIFYERMTEEGQELYYSGTARLARQQVEQETIEDEMLNLGEFEEEDGFLA